jgi:hypothetical protein
MATSKREARQAGKDLRNPATPKQDRGPIASDLAQTPRKSGGANKGGGRKK